MEIRAEALAQLLMSGEVGRRVSLNGTRVIGPLDLGATVLDCEFVALDCVFDGPLDLGDAQTRSVRLAGSTLTGLNLRGVRVEGTLDLSGLRCGPITLSGGHVSGDVHLARARLEGDGAALDLELASIGGHLNATELRTGSGIRLSGCRVDGAITLSKADIGQLVGEQLRVGMTLDCTGVRAAGDIDFGGAEVGKDAIFREAVLVALDATDITVGGRLDLGSARIAGTALLAGARVAGATGLDGLHTHALSLRRARLAADLDAAALTAAGGADLSGAEISGRLSLDGAQLGGEEALEATAMVVRRGMSAEGLEVDGTADLSQAQLSEVDVVATLAHLYAEDMVVTGGARLDLTTDERVNLGGARVDGELVLSGAVGGLDLAGARVVGNLLVNRFSARGLFDLTAAEVTGDVIFSDASFGTVGAFGAAFGQNVLFEGSFQTVPTTFSGDVLLGQATVQKAISFAGLVITGGLYCSRMSAGALVPPVHARELTVMMLDGANITVLADLGAWPETLVTDGLTYARIEVTPDETTARHWLRSNRAYAAQPFHHLAGYLRGLGEDSLARQVLLWQQRAARPQLSRTRRVFSFAMDMLAGYGYAPSRALLILFGSWAAGWAWFSRYGFQWHDGLVMLDLILPASLFGLEDLDQYGRADLVVASVLVGVGWLLSLALLPAVTRSLSRG